MKKLTVTAMILSVGALAACAPYPPGDCRYDNTCRNYPYDQNYNKYEGNKYAQDRIPAGYIDANGERFWLAPDGYYYRDQTYRGPRYYYSDGYYYLEAPPPPRIPPGGMHRPTRPENRPDQY